MRGLLIFIERHNQRNMWPALSSPSLPVKKLLPSNSHYHLHWYQSATSLSRALPSSKRGYNYIRKQEPLVSATSRNMGTVERITLFNVPNEEDRKGMIDQYKELVKTAAKDGKPYISNVSFGIALPDPRSREYNFGVKTTFTSLADVEFYDQECAAHQALKAFAKGRVAGPPLTLIYENAA